MVLFTSHYGEIGSNGTSTWFYSFKKREYLSITGIKGMKNVIKDINEKKSEDQNNTSQKIVRK